MICENCGNEVEKDAVFCTYCGEKVTEEEFDWEKAHAYYMNLQKEKSETFASPPRETPRAQGPKEGETYPSIGIGILCFLFPIVGIILFLAMSDISPKKGKICGIIALASILISVASIYFGLI